MECQELSQEANTLHVKINYTHPSGTRMQKIKSSKYICGALYTEFELASSRITYGEYNRSISDVCIVVTVRFCKLLDDDDLIYTCKLISNQNKLLLPELRIWNDHWHQIVFFTEIEVNADAAWTYLLEVTFHCEIFEGQCVLTSIYDDTESADFKLCGEDGSVKIHKTILAAFSPVFQTMLAGEWKESQKGSVAIQGVCLETLQHLKDYMYLNRLPETVTGLQKLFVLASYYMMQRLVVQCCAKLLNQLDTYNVIEMAEFASRYRVGPLYIAILKTCQKDKINLDELTLNYKTNWLEICKKVNNTE